VTDAQASPRPDDNVPLETIVGVSYNTSLEKWQPVVFERGNPKLLGVGVRYKPAGYGKACDSREAAEAAATQMIEYARSFKDGSIIRSALGKRFQWDGVGDAYLDAIFVHESETTATWLPFEAIVGVSFNTSLEKWHPVVFEPLPLPGSPKLMGGGVRYRDRWYAEPCESHEAAVAAATQIIEGARSLKDGSIIRSAFDHDFECDGENETYCVAFFVLESETTATWLM
jgi:hypothetical protein